MVPSNASFDGTRVDDRKRAAQPAMRFVDHGLLALTRSLVGRIPPGVLRDLADDLEVLASSGELGGIEVPDRCYEIRSPEGRAEVEIRLES